MWISPVSIQESQSPPEATGGLDGLFDEADSARRRPRRPEHKHGLAEHQSLGHGSPGAAIGTLRAVVAQAEIMPRLHVINECPTLTLRVENVAVQLDAADSHLPLGADAGRGIHVVVLGEAQG